MYVVYVLKSEKDGKLYYGFSNNFERRLEEHNSKQVRSTKNRAPFKLVYKESAENLEEARKKEKYFKSGFGRKYVKNQINKLASSSNG